MVAAEPDRPEVRPDQVTLGVLVNAVQRDAVDDAVAACGVREKRSDGKLPAHVVAYLTLGLSLFPDDDYEEVAAKVTGRVVGADRQRDHPGPGRLGRGVFPELFERPCGPVAGDWMPARTRR